MSGLLFELLRCVACLGVWVSAVVVAVAWATVGVPAPGVWFAAVPGGQVLLAHLDRCLSRDD